MANPKFIEDPNMTLRPAAGIPFDPKTLGDGEIIRATKQITNEHGLTQFRMTMPSGREIESEWLREEQLKKALLPWIATIRAELQSDADEVRAQARRVADAQKASKAPVLVSPLGDALTAEPSVPVRTAATTGTRPAPSIPTSVAPSSFSLDPSEFISSSLARARQELDDAAEAARDALVRHKAAAENLDKWMKLAEAMTPNDSTKGDTQHASNSGSASGIASDSRRRGRPPGSKNRPKSAGSSAAASAGSAAPGSAGTVSG